MENRFLTNPIERLFALGKLYEELTVHVVGGKRLGGKHPDVDHSNWNSMIEVKACGSRADPKIYAEQVELHFEGMGWPHEHHVYGIWSYYNPHTRGGHASVKWSQLTTTARLVSEIAPRTRSLYLLDIRIIEAAQLALGTIQDRRYNKPASRIRINTTWLRDFAVAPRNKLRELALNPRSFYIQQATVSLVFKRQAIQFDYTAVLPRSAAGYEWPVHYRERLARQQSAPAVRIAGS